MSFQPVLYIGVGQHGHFFTLRETYQYFGAGSVEVRSFHHFNLSQNPDEAYEKAMAYASQEGIKMVTTRDGLAEELAAIQRATAEQLAARERHLREQQEKWEADRAMWKAQDDEVARAGFCPLRRHAGEAYENIDRGYIHWVVTKRDEFEEGSTIRIMADTIIENYPELLPREMDPTATIGNIGERLDLEVEVVRCAYFDTEWGRVYLVTMVTPEGVCVLSKGRFEAETGEKFTIRATVKDHKEYKGQMQTVVNRTKIVL